MRPGLAFGGDSADYSARARPLVHVPVLGDDDDGSHRCSGPRQFPSRFPSIHSQLLRHTISLQINSFQLRRNASNRRDSNTPDGPKLKQHPRSSLEH